MCLQDGIRGSRTDTSGWLRTGGLLFGGQRELSKVVACRRIDAWLTSSADALGKGIHIIGLSKHLLARLL
jgi:hypothetical protein